MDGYKVSVIIPVYNAEKTIRKCIDSVIAQKIEGIQIIVVNDGSNDNTHLLLNDYNLHNNIQIINKSNTGVSDTRNVGIKHAKGEYLFFLDSDDWIDEDLLKKMYDFAILNNVDLVACDHNEINSTRIEGNSNNAKGFLAIGDKDISNHIYDIFPQSACAKLFKTSVIINNNVHFPVSMSHGEDAFFTYKALLHINSLGKVDNVSYNVQNVNPFSLSKKYISNLGKDLEIQYLLYCDVFEKYPEALPVFVQKKMYLPVLLITSYVNNLYKYGCKDSFFSKLIKVKRYMREHKKWFENEKLKTDNRIPNGLYKKLVYFFITIRSTFFINLLFCFKEKIKRRKYKKMREV